MPAKTLPPIHPGNVLFEDFMRSLGLSPIALPATSAGHPLRIGQIVRGQCAVTVDTAMRLARYFGASAAKTT